MKEVILEYGTTAVLTTIVIQFYIACAYFAHVLEGLARKARGFGITLFSGSKSAGGSKPGAKGIGMFAFSAKEYIRITWSGVSTAYAVSLVLALGYAEVFWSLSTLGHFGIALLAGFINVTLLVIKTSE